jgi:hypothetical protein
MKLEEFGLADEPPLDGKGPVGCEGRWGEWDGLDEGRGGRRKTGIELERVPLCSSCDAEAEGVVDSEVLEKGLETVSRFDGGLSRDRLDMLAHEDEEASRTGRWKSFKRYKGMGSLERDLLKYINGFAGSDRRVSLFFLPDGRPENI